MKLLKVIIVLALLWALIIPTVFSCDDHDFTNDFSHEDICSCLCCGTQLYENFSIQKVFNVSRFLTFQKGSLHKNIYTFDIDYPPELS